MIAVRRTETVAEPGDLDRLIQRLDTEPGLFMGCDVAVDGLYAREFWALVDPPLAFAIVGDRLEVTPRSGLGAALARLVPAQGSPLDRLRGFLAQFPADPALGLFGGWTFDYCRLAGLGAPAGPKTRIASLFFATEVLRGDRWIRFALDIEPVPFAAAPEPPAPPPATLGDDFRPGEHAQLVGRAVERMRRGELISCVMSQSFRRPWTGDAGLAFAQLRRTNPNPFMYFANFGGGERLFGASPDQQCRTEDGWVHSAPVCGTFRRGRDPIEDAEQARALVNASTDESSLAVCSDSDRNDKAKVCEPGSIELLSRRRLLFLSTIVHTVDHQRGRLRPGVDGFDVLLAHTAPSTVVGTPKPKAVVAVAELEPSPRVWYAGAIARLGTDGSCEAGTILRYVWLRGGWAEVRTGGSLLPTSEPEREEAETLLKTEALFRVLGLAPAAPAAPPAPAPLPVRLVDNGDPFPHALANALGGVGAVPGTTGTAVVAGAWTPVEGPALALGEAAHDLLDGTPLVIPENAKVVEAEGEGLLAPLGRFRAGLYARRRVDAVGADWRVLARAADGRVLAAEHTGRPLICLLFRPDSVLSSQAAAGARALRLALDRLSRG